MGIERTLERLGGGRERTGSSRSFGHSLHTVSIAFLAMTLLATIMAVRPASAAENGFTIHNHWTSETTYSAGSSGSYTVDVTSQHARSNLIVQMEIRPRDNWDDNAKILNQWFEGEEFWAGETKRFAVSFVVPPGSGGTEYMLHAQIYDAGWSPLAKHFGSESFQVSGDQGGWSAPPAAPPAPSAQAPAGTAPTGAAAYTVRNERTDRSTYGSGETGTYSIDVTTDRAVAGAIVQLEIRPRGNWDQSAVLLNEWTTDVSFTAGVSRTFTHTFTTPHGPVATDYELSAQIYDRNWNVLHKHYPGTTFRATSVVATQPQPNAPTPAPSAPAGPALPAAEREPVPEHCRTVATGTHAENPTVGDRFVAEPMVSPEWLITRNQLFDQARDRYNAELAASQARQSGPAWVEETYDFQVSNDWSETRTRMRFQPDVFASLFQSEPANLDPIAWHYQYANTAQLLNAHPNILSLIVDPNRGAHVGPGVNGAATAPGGQLAIYDAILTLSDVQSAIARVTVNPPPATSEQAKAQVASLGLRRYEQLWRYNEALKLVRADYGAAQVVAYDTARSEFFANARWDNGPDDPGPTFQFDLSHFSECYGWTNSSSARLFRHWYGVSSNHVIESTEGGDVYGPRFLGGTTLISGGYIRQNGIAHIDIDWQNNLHHPQAVVFHPTIGWVTANDNLDTFNNRLGQVMPMLAVLVVGYLSGGIASHVFGTGMVGTVVSAATSSAAQAALVSALGGPSFDWDNVLESVGPAIVNRLNPWLRDTTETGRMLSAAYRGASAGAFAGLFGADVSDSLRTGFLNFVFSISKAELGSLANSGELDWTEDVFGKQFLEMLRGLSKVAASGDDRIAQFAAEMVDDYVLPLYGPTQ